MDFQAQHDSHSRLSDPHRRFKAVSINGGNPKSSIALSMRAGVYNNLEEYRKAVADSSAAIKLDPKHGDAYNARATAYDALGDKKLAKIDKLKADQLSPLEASE